MISFQFEKKLVKHSRPREKKDKMNSALSSISLLGGETSRRIFCARRAYRHFRVKARRCALGIGKGAISITLLPPQAKIIYGVNKGVKTSSSESTTSHLLSSTAFVTLGGVWTR